jgi:serine/threonine protein kinase
MDEDLRFEKKLCRGSFAEVYRGVLHGKQVAIKEPRKDKVNSGKAAVRELRILEVLKHQNISKLVGSVNKEGQTIICTELMDGDLRSLVAQDEMSLFDKIDVALQLARAMAFMHEKGFVHQDIKLDNVLYRKRDMPQSNGSRYDVQLCDFGLSRCARGPFTNSTRLGTPVYMPPEVLKGNVTLTKSVDVYSFALALWEMFSGKTAYSSYSRFSQLRQDVVVNGVRPEMPSEMPSRLQDLLKSCWHPDASCRPHFHSVVSELSSICSDAIMSETSDAFNFLASPSTGSPFGFYGL